MSLDSLFDDDQQDQTEVTWPQTSSVREYIDNQYRSYSKYVLHERAIPHLIDGFKPSQRKIFFTAKKAATASKVKTASLSGSVITLANYHHGDSSLNDATVGMTALYANNIPAFVGTGTFGSRLIQEAAAPRYTYVQYNSKELDKIFLDDDILPKHSDPDNPEPSHYLPVIPWVMVNGVRGVAIGFATNILPRDPRNLARACSQFLRGKAVDESLLIPSFPHFNGVVEQDENDDKRWFVKGTFERKGKTSLVITEVPYGYDRAKYIEKLEEAKAKGVITSYADKCRDTFKFEVRMSGLDKLTDDQVLTKLKLVKTYKDNLVVIDHHNQVRVFDTPLDLLKEFCKVRLTHFQRRYDYWVERDTEEKAKTDEKIRFIRLVLARTIDINGKTRKQLKDELTKNEFADDMQDMLVSMPIYHLCQDKLEELEAASEQLGKDIECWKATDINKAYITDLKKVK